MNGSKNYYFIEGSTDDDLIGFESYIDDLNSAISSGAKFIGLISDFGTGKSSLLKMLDGKKDGNYNIITINLWDVISNSENNNKLEIHNIFLHQLIEKLKIKSSEYYKKRINKNYSPFDIKLKSSRFIYIFFLFCFFLCGIFDTINFYNFYANNLELYIYFLIIILTFLCVLIYKPMVSFKREDTSRSIDENDTKDLYVDILNAYRESKVNKDKLLVICLEELDRYNNPETILEYLKEFYKFYKLVDDKVVFIISINSASFLKKFDSKKEIEEIKDVYEKVFDFILNINPINIEDYDSVIIQLLNKKNICIPDGIRVPKESNLKNWKYLYKGKKITIRDIKHRYNFAISLYLSVKGAGIDKVDFSKCLFLSYLEDEYNELYNKIVKTNNLMDKILVQYANKKNIDEIEDLNDVSNEGKSALMEGLQSKFISIDYNYYLYKFPKTKKSFNSFERVLYNSIFFDEDSSQLFASIDRLDDIQIGNIIDMRTNELFVPTIVFKYSKLAKVAYDKQNRAFMNTLDKNYDLINSFNKFTSVVNYLKKLPERIYRNILSDYFNLKYDQLKNLNDDQILEIRKKVCALLGKDAIMMKDFFMNNYTVISSEEIKSINDANVVFELTNFDKITDSYIDDYKVLIKNSSKSFIMKLLNAYSQNEHITFIQYNNIFYSIDFHNYNLTSNEFNRLLNFSKEKLELNNLVSFCKYLDHLNYYSEYYDNYLLSIINKEDDNENNTYSSILNKYNIIYSKGIDYFLNLNNYFRFSEDIRNEFYSAKAYKYYVISTKIDNNNYEVEDDKLVVLKNEYINHFIEERDWKYFVGPKMKKMLYDNLDFSKLSSSQLVVFNDLVQTKELISSILKTSDDSFINNYLSHISNMRKRDELEIYTLIGEYNRNVSALENKTKKNLLKITNSLDCKKLLDRRRKKLKK